ncbi:MAG TPA: amino acid permease [Gemmatimonadales bacterium]|nr:amino acid permease [Gemmatimonadales bacterium]
MADVTDLKRQLTLLDATMINVGTIIASAIFIVPAEIALGLHATSLMVLVWIVGGIVSLLGALSIAELAAAMPEAGGGYVYLREAYSPVWGWLYGWANGIVINPASIAAIAVGFAGYAGHFTALSAGGIKIVAIVSILALTVLNVLGVKAGAITQNVLTLIKIATLTGLILVGFILPGGSSANLQPFWPGGGTNFGAFGVAMLAVLWAYDGWIETTYVGGEVVKPERNLPRAIIYSALICMVLYVLVTVSFTYVLGPERVAGSKLVASDAAAVTLGVIGAGLVAAAILVSTLGANNGIVLTAARIPYAMARDRLLFSSIGKVHPRWLTPANSLYVQAVISIALTLTGKYNWLYTYVVFAEFVFYALMCGALIRLRQRRPDMPRPYRAWGYPVTPILFIAFSLWLVVNTIIQDPKDSAVAAGLIAVGLPVYWYFKKKVSAISYQPSA